MSPGSKGQGRAGTADRYLANLARFGSRPGLERISRLLSALGNPEYRVPVVHVCGTNGKGSVASLLACLAQARGFRVGLYTSPHLQHYRERVQVQGTWIRAADWEEILLDQVAPRAEAVARETGEHPTEFEALTALAFQYFASEQVDLAVVEAGMGGRLDATNAGNPLGTIITRIGYDHVEVLGPGLDNIAREKAALIRAARPVISAAQEQEAEAVILDRCRSMRAPLLRCGREFWSCQRRSAETGWLFQWTGPRFSWPELFLKRLGEHQVENCQLALAASQLLLEPGPGGRGRSQIRAALGNCPWPGRMELFPGKKDILLDAAHNPGGVQALTRGLRQHFSRRRVTVVFSALADKDIAEMVRILRPEVKFAVVPRAESLRAAEPGAIAEIWTRQGIPVECADSIGEALDLGLKQTPEENGLLLVCGSFALVGPARSLVRSR